MKKIIIVLYIVLSGVFFGCTKMKVETANVQGEWKLESFYGVEAAGSVAQEVYVDFKSDFSKNSATPGISAISRAVTR